MNFPIEDKLLTYLQGKISFNEWLEGATASTDNSTLLLENSTSQQIPFYHQEDTIDQAQSAKARKCQEVDDEAADLLEKSAKIASNFPNSAGKVSFRSDGGRQTGNDSNVSDVGEDFDDDYEEDLFNESEMDEDLPTENEHRLPEFNLPDGLLSPSSGNPELKEKMLVMIKKMSEVLTDLAKSVKDKTEDPSIMKMFADFIAPKQRKLRKSGPSSHKLREDLRQQMGMANLYLAKGQIDEAMDVCMEIIRQAPHNPHAFKTLSVIHDEKGDTEKSLQYALISAFLGYQDPHEWRGLAIRCLQAGNRKQALVCYTNGCKVSRKNIILRWERASLVFEDGDYKRALELYSAILKLIPSSDGKNMIELAKLMAQLHHSVESISKATDILEFISEKYSSHLDVEGINMLAELHILAKNFEEALEVICKYSGVHVPDRIIKDLEMQASSSFEHVEEDTGLRMPDTMMNCINQLAQTSEVQNVEFTTKFAESLIQDISSKDSSKHTDLVTAPSSWTDFLLSPTKANRLEDGKQTEKDEQRLDSSQKDLVDLDESTAAVRDVSSATGVHRSKDWFIPDDLPIDLRVKTVLCLIELKIHCNFREILDPLFSESIDDVGDLYLDIAEAYINVGMSESALTYLEELVKTEKYSKAAVWLKIAECRQNIGLLSEAVIAYYKVLDLAPDQLGVTIELADLCKRLGRKEEAIKLLSEPNNSDTVDESNAQRIVEITNKDDFKLWYQKCTLLHGQGHNAGLAESGYIFFINYFKSAAISREEGMSKALVWELLVKVLQAMVSGGQNARAKEVVESASSFRSFSENRRYRCELEFISATTYFLIGDYTRAFDFFRYALQRTEKRGLDSPAMWNFFGRIISNMPDRKSHKYILRMLFKQPASLPLIIMNGHNAFLCGTYKYAIGEYIRAFRMKPQDPMLSMCIGITYLHIACQRFTKHRNTSVLQGIAFMLQYYHMRGRTQEACYNIGRAFHQVGLVHFAYIFYHKALEFPTRNKKYSQFDDLHREAAYNLALIYKNSGNKDLARRTLFKYVCI